MLRKFHCYGSFVDVGGKAKFCVNCGNTAAQEALFNVDEAGDFSRRGSSGYYILLSFRAGLSDLLQFCQKSYRKACYYMHIIIYLIQLNCHKVAQ